MKYFSVEKINRAIRAIRENTSTQEHVTSRDASELARYYFNKEVYTIVPGQIQKGTNKIPDCILEKFVVDN